MGRFKKDESSEVKVVVKRSRKKKPDIAISEGEVLEYSEEVLPDTEPVVARARDIPRLPEGFLIAPGNPEVIEDIKRLTKSGEMIKNSDGSRTSSSVLEAHTPEEKKHSKFGSPSGLYKIEKCPGSIAYGEGHPDLPTTKYAEEGTVFHEYMERVTPRWLNGEFKEEELHDIIKTVPAEYPDMSEMIYQTLDEIKRRWELFCSFHPDSFFKCELAVAVDDDIFGTCDLVFVGTNNFGKINVVAIDYKFGMGVKVSAESNRQVIAYTLGAIKTLNIEPHTVGLCVAVIAQVRLPDGWSKYSFHGSEIPEWTKRLKDIVGIAKVVWTERDEIDVVKYLHAGKHCRFCKCQSFCVELKRDCLDEMAIGFEEFKEEVLPAVLVDKLTLDQRVAIHAKKSQIEDFLKANALSLSSDAFKGIEIPGYKLVQTAGRRSWIKDVDQVGAALIERGVRDPYKRSIIGLGEVEGQIGKGKIGDLTTKSEGKIELVVETDKRIAVNVQDMLGEVTEINIEE